MIGDAETNGRPPADGDLVARIRALLVRTLDLPADNLPAEPGMNLHGRGLSVDSLDALQLVAALEEEFDITIDERELGLPVFERVDTIVGLVRRLTNHPGHPSAT